MKLCPIYEIKENDILARDVMTDDYNVLLYKNTILNKKYIEKLKTLGIPYIYIQDNIPQEEIVILKKEVELKSKLLIKEILQKKTYNTGNELIELNKTADEIITHILDEDEVIENIYDIKERSADIYSHSISICVLSTLVGLHLGLDKERVHDIGVACLLHDLGLKYLLIDYEDQDIDLLSPKELIEYKKHPVYGYTALKNENWISKNSKEMILCHHERIDGSGYPLHATEISLDTKIINVCDTFDEYICGIGRRKMKIHEAVEYMKSHAGNVYDKKIVEALLKFTAVYPSGTKVRTNKGELAVVIRQNKHFPERPIIQILARKNGHKVEEEEIIDMIKVNNIMIDEVLE